MKACNQCRVSYSYCPVEGDYPIRTTVYSNRVETTILTAQVKLTVSACANTVGYLDCLCYRVTVQNMTTLPLHHLTLKTAVSPNAIFECHSFYLNGHLNSEVTQLDCVTLPDLSPRQIHRISYCLRVQITACDRFVENRTKVCYGHCISDNQPLIPLCVRHRPIYTPLHNTYVQTVYYHSCCSTSCCERLQDITILDVEPQCTVPQTYSVRLNMTFYDLKTKTKRSQETCIHLICTKSLTCSDAVAVFLVNQTFKRSCCNQTNVLLEFILATSPI